MEKRRSINRSRRERSSQIKDAMETYQRSEEDELLVLVFLGRRSHHFHGDGTINVVHKHVKFVETPGVGVGNGRGWWERSVVK